MMVMAFQSSPIFSLPRARLECSVFRFMRQLGVLRASYYHGREATEASRGREFGATPVRAAQMRKSLQARFGRADGDYHDISNTSSAHGFQSCQAFGLRERH